MVFGCTEPVGVVRGNGDYRGLAAKYELQYN